MPLPCDILAERMGRLYTCSDVGEYVRVRTPFLYPDGDVIDLFVKTAGGAVTVTDMGESIRWLRMQTVSTGRRTEKQRRLLADIGVTQGVELFKGMLSARVRAPEELPYVVQRVAQAAGRVADLWFTMRTRAVETVTDEVADFLEEKKIAYERPQPLAGRSGRTWRVDFHTRTPSRSALVSVLHTGSRAAAHGIVEHTLAAWFDLNLLKVGPEALRFVSLFDDTEDVWSDEDFRLLSEVSDLSMWSRPDQFAELLVA